MLNHPSFCAHGLIDRLCPVCNPDYESHMKVIKQYQYINKEKKKTTKKLCPHSEWPEHCYICTAVENKDGRISTEND